MTPRIPLRISSPPTITRTLPRSLQPYQRALRAPISPLCRPFLRLQSHSNYSTSNSPPLPDTPRPADLRSQLNANPVIRSTVPPPKTKRSLRPYIYATFFLLLGLTAGQYVRLVIAPPALPSPGSKEDTLMVGYLKREAEKLPLVKLLTEDPKWTSHDAYEGLSAEARDHILSTGPMGGARALGGFQRIFYNAETGEVVTVVWFGGALAGWPGVTHGGAIATMLDEALGRCAIWKLPGRIGVTAALQLKYLKPVVTNSFYMIKAAPQEDQSTDTKQWVNGRLETVDGKICVEARGLFVVPKKYETPPISPTL